MPDRSVILIDGGHLNTILREEFDSPRIDYPKLVRELGSDSQVLRTYYYTCEPWQGNPPTAEERANFAKTQRFLDYLDHLPNFDVRLGRLAKAGKDDNGYPIYVQKQVDVLMTIDLLRLSMLHSVSRAIMLTSDSDFIPVINAAKDQGIEIYLAHGSNPPRAIISAADARIRIDREFINRIRRNENHQSNHAGK